MARKLKSDKILFLAVLFLVCVSAVMVCSASAALALQKHWNVSHFLFRQMTWVLVGFLLMGVTMRIRYQVYQQSSVIWSALGAVALALVFVLGDGQRDQRQPPLVRLWRHRRAAVRACQARHRPVCRGPAGTTHGARERGQGGAAAGGPRARAARRLDPAAAGSRHGGLPRARDRCDSSSPPVSTIATSSASA